MAEARAAPPIWSSQGARSLILAAAAAVFLALSGAFQTQAAGLPIRLAYWLVLMLAGTLWSTFLVRVLVRAPWLAGRPWLALVVLTVITSLPYTVVVWAMTLLLFGVRLDPKLLPSFVGPVFVVSMAMGGLNLLAGWRPRETHQAPAGAAPPRFLDRLPGKLKGAELYAVQSEGHYLRLYTSKGSDLILMRLSDALAELEGLEGAQTHRSWWVAKAAVEGAARSDGRASLSLRGGIEAPVSRSYSRALREGGWY